MKWIVLKTVKPLVLVLALVLLAACGENMGDGSRLEPYEPADFFPQNQAARPVEADTVARGLLREDEHFYQGTVDGQPASTFPISVTREVLERGRERYNIFCSPCHAADGYGRGMIVQRGFPPPPSFHSERLREAPVGHYFNVITNGIGVMYPYGYRVPPQDRWAIIAYIRALQLSQRADIEELTPEERQQLEQEQQESQEGHQ